VQQVGSSLRDSGKVSPYQRQIRSKLRMESLTGKVKINCIGLGVHHLLFVNYCLSLTVYHLLFITYCSSLTVLNIFVYVCYW
jgi:hypothetical protein